MFIPPNSAPKLLATLYLIIAFDRQVLFTIFSCQALAYNNALDWFQFAFTGEKMVAYIAPAETEPSSLWIIKGSLVGVGG